MNRPKKDAFVGLVRRLEKIEPSKAGKYAAKVTDKVIDRLWPTVAKELRCALEKEPTATVNHFEFAAITGLSESTLYRMATDWAEKQQLKQNQAEVQKRRKKQKSIISTDDENELAFPQPKKLSKDEAKEATYVRWIAGKNAAKQRPQWVASEVLEWNRRRRRAKAELRRAKDSEAARLEGMELEANRWWRSLDVHSRHRHFVVHSGGKILFFAGLSGWTQHRAAEAIRDGARLESMTIKTALLEWPWADFDERKAWARAFRARLNRLRTETLVAMQRADDVPAVSLNRKWSMTERTLVALDRADRQALQDHLGGGLPAAKPRSGPTLRL